MCYWKLICTEPIKQYVDILSAMLTPIIAILAVYIAWQQYRVQHKGLNSQLYERKRMVFLAFMAFLSDIMREGKTSSQRVAQFYADAAEVDFLFGDSIISKRDELFSNGNELADLQEKLYPSGTEIELFPGSPERQIAAQRKTQLFLWFTNEISVVKQLFKEDIGIK